LVLAECKDHARPVEREDVQVLADKLRAAGAQKGMLFSTNGFQKGAIDYARSHGIALIRIIEGALTYETRGAARSDYVRPTPPPSANIPLFVGQLVSLAENGHVHVSVVERGRTNALRQFLESA
jgi:restriction system protein